MEHRAKVYVDPPPPAVLAVPPAEWSGEIVCDENGRIQVEETMPPEGSEYNAAVTRALLRRVLELAGQLHDENVQLAGALREHEDETEALGQFVRQKGLVQELETWSQERAAAAIQTDAQSLIV